MHLSQIAPRSAEAATQRRSGSHRSDAKYFISVICAIRER